MSFRSQNQNVYFVMASQVIKAPDMSEEEVQVLIQEFERRKAVIDSEEKTVDFAKKRDRAWEEITEAVNACSDFRRSTAQVKTKLKNLKTRAKTRFQAAKRHSGHTGGGPPAKQLSFAEEKLVAMYSHSAGWSGIPGGAESSVIPPYEETMATGETPESAEIAGASADTEGLRPSSPVPEMSDTRTPRGQDTSVRNIRQLQVRALETQIRANESIVATCQSITIF